MGVLPKRLPTDGSCGADPRTRLHKLVSMQRIRFDLGNTVVVVVQ